MWITFTDGSAGYVQTEGDSEAHKKIAEKLTGKLAAKVEIIPYPANPIIWQDPPPKGFTNCPPFCTSPEKCVGRSSCPRSYACND